MICRESGLERGGLFGRGWGGGETEREGERKFLAVTAVRKHEPH